jgi:hypothetical protein
MATQDKARKERDGAERPEAEEDGGGGANGQGSSTLRRAVTAGAVAAAAGTTVAAAAKMLSSRGAEGTSAASRRGADITRVRDAARRGEPLMSAGWEAARDSVTPLVETGARAAGSFIGERSPDFVRESVVPPFIEGFNKGRKKGGT